MSQPEEVKEDSMVTVIVTGATSGLGRGTAKEFITRGYNVILACRDAAKAEETAVWLNSTNTNSSRSNVATFVELDLASIESIRAFVDSISKLDITELILINNAGQFPKHRNGMPLMINGVRVDRTLMVNYFGHQLLTSLLMDALGGKLREVVNVSSGLAKNAPLDIAVDILNPDESKYSAKDMYTLSKLYMDAMAYKIDSDANSPTRALSVYPGFVPNTNLGRDFAWYERLFTSLMAYMPFATSEQGAVGYIVNAALSINQHEKGTVINQKGTWIPYSQRAKDIASSSLPSLQSI